MTVDGIRMVAAEVLRVVRRRALMVWPVTLSLGVIGFYYGFFAVRHAMDPLHHPPAGGLRSLCHLLDNYELVVALLAIPIGATAATADVSAGCSEIWWPRAGPDCCCSRCVSRTRSSCCYPRRRPRPSLPGSGPRPPSAVRDTPGAPAMHPWRCSCRPDGSGHPPGVGGRAGQVVPGSGVCLVIRY